MDDIKEFDEWIRWMSEWNWYMKWINVNNKMNITNEWIDEINKLNELTPGMN